MTKTIIRIKKESTPKERDLLVTITRRVAGLVVSFVGLAIGIFAAMLLTRSFSWTTLFLHSIPLFVIGGGLIIQGLATGRGLTWREALEVFMDTLRFM